ncbi:GNAT family N-acetyltransferase [bacterium]|nr:GNAT family N-acetyltransferase [bacterium]
MNDEVEIVWGSVEQLDDVKKLENEAEANWGNPDSFFEEELAAGRVAIAYLDNEPIGYLVFQVIWGNTPFLALIRVSPSSQRSGVGTLLIQHFETRLQGHGFDSFVTSSERVNPNTKEFFPKLGLKPIGALEMKHGEELFYIKYLNAS